MHANGSDGAHQSVMWVLEMTTGHLAPMPYVCPLLASQLPHHLDVSFKAHA